MSLIAGNLGVVQRLLDEHQLTWAVCAGAAAHLYGDRRPIQDIDIVVASGALTTVVKLLQGAQKAVQFDGHRILWRGIKLFDDISIRRDGSVYPFAFDGPMRDHLRRLPLLGSRVAVLAPEDVIIHKLILGRGPEQGKHDQVDAAGIVRRQTLNADYMIERLHLCNGRALVEPKLREMGVALPPGDGG